MRAVKNALWEIVVDFQDDEEEEEKVSADIIILQK